MDDQTKQLILQSWSTIKSKDLTQTGHNMFVKLLSDNPAVIPMFYFVEDTSEAGLRANQQLAKHGKGVMTTLDKAVAALDTPEVLVNALKALGGRHHSKGVTVDLFEPVGAALLWALADAAGDVWTPDVQHAWEQVYGVVTEHMSTGLQEKAQKAASS